MNSIGLLTSENHGEITKALVLFEFLFPVKTQTQRFIFSCACYL